MSSKEKAIKDISNVVSDITFNKNLNVEGTAKIKNLEVENFNADITLNQNNPIKFEGQIDGKGFLWSGKDYTKQFVFRDTPNRFWSSEDIDLDREKVFRITTGNRFLFALTTTLHFLISLL